MLSPPPCWLVTIAIASFAFPAVVSGNNREDYATIDNAGVFDIDFEDLSCTLTPQAVPAGWRLADWDADIAFVSPTYTIQSSSMLDGVGVRL